MSKEDLFGQKEDQKTDLSITGNYIKDKEYYKQLNNEISELTKEITETTSARHTQNASPINKKVEETVLKNNESKKVSLESNKMLSQKSKSGNEESLLHSEVKMTIDSNEHNKLFKDSEGSGKEVYNSKLNSINEEDKPFNHKNKGLMSIVNNKSSGSIKNSLNKYTNIETYAKNLDEIDKKLSLLAMNLEIAQHNTPINKTPYTKQINVLKNVGKQEKRKCSSVLSRNIGPASVKTNYTTKGSVSKKTGIYNEKGNKLGKTLVSSHVSKNDDSSDLTNIYSKDSLMFSNELKSINEASETNNEESVGSRESSREFPNEGKKRSKFLIELQKNLMYIENYE